MNEENKWESILKDALFPLSSLKGGLLKGGEGTVSEIKTVLLPLKSLTVLGLIRRRSL